MSRQVLVVGIILLIVPAVFCPLFRADFTSYDDPTTIEFNPAFNPPTVAKILPIWTAWGDRAPLGLYIPATYTLWGLIAATAYSDLADAQGSHLIPWVFHATNILLHTLTTVLVYQLFKRLLKSTWPALAGTLLFAVHPLQVEAVAWASGTKDLLCGLLSVSAIRLHLRQAQALRPNRFIKVVEVLLVLLAMLAKPVAIITPLLALILDATFLRRNWRATLTDLWPWLLLMPACAGWAHAAQPANWVPAAPLWARPILALDSIWFYLHKVVFPLHLTVDYGRKPLYVLGLSSLWFTAPLALLAAAAPIIAFRRRPKWWSPTLIFVTGLAPVLGFLPFTFQQFSQVADHYLYLPMLGIGLGCGLIIKKFPNIWLYSTYGVILLMLSTLTFAQARLWQHEINLWQHGVAINPQSMLARINYGAALYRSNRLIEAEQQFAAAAIIDPRDLDAQDNLALVELNTGRPDQAIEHLQRELQLAAKLPLALRTPLDGPYVMLGRALLATNDLKGAKSAFESALKEDPASTDAADQLKRVTARAATTLPF